MTNTQKFLEKFSLEMTSLGKAMVEFPWENSNAYAYWLGQTYYFVRHSTRLLSLAASKFVLEDEKSHLRFLAHVGEEKSHDRLALADLTNLSWEIKNIPELSPTSALYQTQFYWINQVSPHSFMGYIFALEGIAESKGKEIHLRVEAAHGKKCAQFVKVHSNEDEGHLQKAFTQLEGLTEKEMIWTEENFVKSCAFYNTMLASIKKGALITKLKKTA